MSYYQDFLKDKATGGQHGTHYIYWVPIDVFNQLSIDRWKFNRPPDEQRIKEIHEYMKTSKRVDGMIYLACINNKIVCYEANHRREALKGIEGMNHILVDMIWNATDDVIKEEFTRLNKAISVPELYFEEIGPETEVIFGGLKEAVDLFCDNYKDMKVGSKHPQRPNFTRDGILDEFYRVMKENRIGIQELQKRLLKLNNEMANRDKSKLSEKVIQKCQKNGLWLFAWSSKLNSDELK